VAGAIVSLVYFEILNLSGGGLAYWRVDNFLVYIPVSYFIYKQEGKNLSRYIYPCWFLFVIFMVQDIVLRNFGYNTGVYSRFSVVFGSVAIFITILSMRNIEKNTVAYLLSRHSLGIYATHKYMQFFVIISLQHFGLVKPIHISWLPVELRVLIIAVLTLLLTVLAIFMLCRTPLKRYVI
jgi:surface polysaccharide O-acyltransferase-like enzyme